MRSFFKVFLLSGFCFFSMRFFAKADSTGADPGYSGAPGDSTCISCHGTTLNSGTGSVKISFANGTTYIPGQSQVVTVTIADPTAKRWGFEASPRLSSAPTTTGAGTVSTADSNTRIAGMSGTLQWITHSLAGTRNGTTGGVSFNFNWTAPATDVGAVNFYVAANAANGNNLDDSGDKIYTTKATLTAAVVNSNTPTIASGGVVNAASAAQTIESGSWVTIYGTNLAPNTITSGRSWTAAEIVNGVLPTSLDGTSVTINGKPAAISWVSNGQLNVQAPDDAATGPVAVVVKTANGTSDPATVNMMAISPGLFTLTSKYPAALLPDGTYAIAAGVLGASVPSRAATAGDVVQLFGTGFGATSPAVTSGVVYGGAAETANSVTATIGGVPAEVQFAGMTGAGLYQINVTVPAWVPSGDQPLVLSVGGVATQSSLYLTIQ
jgi:uncharacterized protein (TIGR03437 family)